MVHVVPTKAGLQFALLADGERVPNKNFELEL